MITIYTINTIAMERAVELFSPLDKIRKSIYISTSYNLMTGSANINTLEEDKITKLLTEWTQAPHLKFKEQSWVHPDTYHIFLPFKKDEDVPLLPSIKEDYYKDSTGFLTNPNNWSKGLDLL